MFTVTFGENQRFALCGTAESIAEFTKLYSPYPSDGLTIHDQHGNECYFDWETLKLEVKTLKEEEHEPALPVCVGADYPNEDIQDYRCPMCSLHPSYSCSCDE